jgi:serine/threonine protein phosphatase PrpC
VRVCSRCGTSYDDEELFCDLDGEALASEAELSGSGEMPTLKMRVGALGDTCKACGERLANDGEGYCRACGYRLEVPRRDAHRGFVSVEGGVRVGPFEVVAAAGDELRGRDTRVPPGDPAKERDLVVGLAPAVNLEAQALDMLARETTLGVARVIERGHDARRGDFIVLSPAPPGSFLFATVLDVELEMAMGLLGRAADLASALESHRLFFRPASQDLFATGEGELWIRRLRGLRRLAPDERFDVAPLFQALGDALLPLPLSLVSSEVLHLVCVHAAALGDPRLTIEDARQRIEGARVAPGGPYGQNVAASTAAPERTGLSIDQGMRRDHNEDAAAFAEGAAGSGRLWATLVVCDGVSASTHADEASRIASKTTSDSLAHFVTSGDVGFESSQHGMAQAIRAAHISICAFAARYSADEPPGTTIVSALVHGPRLTIGWVGDSRAYWVASAGPAELLTRDHSWVNETVERGEMTEAEALQQPLAHALTRCLGPLESRGGPIMVTPDVITRVIRDSGHLILCSDGFWNYYPGADDVASLVRAAESLGERSPNAIARYLLNHALAAGGQDNVTVMVYAHDAREA